jgi:hypothetical protein
MNVQSPCGRVEKDLHRAGGTEYRQNAKLFLQSPELELPHPLSRIAGECAPPPLVGGGAHALAGEGLGESQFRRGEIHMVLYMYKSRRKSRILHI